MPHERSPVHGTARVDGVGDGRLDGFDALVWSADGNRGRLGINVKLDRGNGSGDTVAKVAAGAYDMGLADTNTMVRFNANNPGNQLIAVAMVQDASASGVVGLRSKGIEKPADLAGKRIYAPAATMLSA